MQRRRLGLLGGGAAALGLDAEVRDAKGAVKTGFYTSDVLTFAAVIRNPCTEDVEFQSNVGCFVASWGLAGSKTAVVEPTVCDQAITDFTVPAEGILEETVVWGQVDADKYSMTVTYTYGSMSAFANFQVK